MAEPTQAVRNHLLLWIGQLWRGDWSGHTFDGQDGQSWIITAVTGDEDECESLSQTLKDIEDSY